MGTITFTPITKLSVGGNRQAFLCSYVCGGTYATGGDTPSFAGAPAPNFITEIIDLDVQVGTDNQQGVGNLDPASGLVKYNLATTGAEVANGRTLTPYGNGACVVFGR